MKHARLRLFGHAGLLLVLMTHAAFAQTGTIRGTVTDQKTGEAIPAVNVVVEGTTTGAATDVNGRYEIRNLKPGTYTLMGRHVAHEPRTIKGVVVTAGGTTVRNFQMTDVTVQLGEMTVYGASRRAERITEAPAAITALAPKEIELKVGSGQVPSLLEMKPGVDIVQSGVQDFNINTRGFNSSLNRRLLVLMDGRDLAVAFLGAQEWNSLSVPIEDLGSLELVRGPGSALYGPNAFNGVINITTPAPKDIRGTKLTYASGELSTQRVDVRNAGVINENWSYKANVGRVQSGTWSRSRTVNDRNAKGEFEYPGLEINPATKSATAELRALNPGDVTSSYGSARVDYNFDGNVITGEGGFAEVQNELFVTGIGRVQVTKAHKPWGRLNFSTDQLNVMLWAQGRKSVLPQYSLLSGAPLHEESQIYNGEVQYNLHTLEDQLRVVVGVSGRLYQVDTKSTLMKDKHVDRTGAVFGQLEYSPTEWIKFVGAGRYDQSTLHEGQVSPKAAVVWSPDPDHSLRATFNKAFQVPNYSEFFLTAAAGSADVSLFRSPLNPNGTIPILARGNSTLDVEKVTGYEIGYKGIFMDKRVFVTLDGYFNIATNFITDLLQAVNPAYPFVPPAGFAGNPVLEAAVRAQAPGLTVVDGRPAIVVSYTNAGEVEEQGVELGVNFYADEQVLVSGNWTWYDFKVVEQLKGDILIPNAPKHKFSLGFSWTRPDGIDLSINARNVQAFDWAAGVFAGRIPAYTIVNMSAGWRINENYRIGCTISNAFDNRVYQLFGGSVIGRHAIVSLNARF